MAGGHSTSTCPFGPNKRATRARISTLTRINTPPRILGSICFRKCVSGKLSTSRAPKNAIGRLPAAIQADSWEENVGADPEEGTPERKPWPLRPSFGDEGLIDYLDYDIVLDEELTIDYRSLLYSRRAAGSRGRGMHMVRHDLGLTKYYLAGACSLAGRIRLLDLDTDARLPDTGERLPRHLWDMRAGVTMPVPIPSPVLVTVNV